MELGSWLITHFCECKNKRKQNLKKKKKNNPVMKKMALNYM
jgi:hypothetical protein